MSLTYKKFIFHNALIMEEIKTRIRVINALVFLLTFVGVYNARVCLHYDKFPYRK